jgi:hypothetical protein
VLHVPIATDRARDDGAKASVGPGSSPPKSRKELNERVRRRHAPPGRAADHPCTATQTYSRPMHAWLHNARYGLHKHTSRAAAGGPCPATRARTPKNTAPLVPCLPPARVAGRRLRLLHARARARGGGSPGVGSASAPAPAPAPRAGRRVCITHSRRARTRILIGRRRAAYIYIYMFRPGPYIQMEPAVAVGRRGRTDDVRLLRQEVRGR